MKISRLFSILIYLLNRELVSASELAERFEVSVRTIQRDIDTLCYSGIPVLSVQGVRGGYGIVDNYKLDRQMIDTSDLFFILTALESMGTTYQNKKITSTLEKVKAFVQDCHQSELDAFKHKLDIDFSALSLGKKGSELFCILDQAIDDNHLVEFTYTNVKQETTHRKVEPMTIAFKWFSWYLFGYCHLRNDFRLFRLSRIQNIQMLKDRFERKEKQLSDCSSDVWGFSFVDLVLKFHPSMNVFVTDYFRNANLEIQDDGYIKVGLRYPDDVSMYGMILSYGDRVEVIEPENVRKSIGQMCTNMARKYHKL